jgi:tetratricopeptide (TPR) repeat protein
MYEEALAVRREMLPFQHPDIVDALNNLASLHKSEGEYYRALPLFEEALAIRRATLPHEHPDIIASLQKLVRLHEMKGEYDRALPLYEEVLAIRRAMGIEQPDSAPPRHL